MTTTRNFNIDPYYDDYSVLKNFHRILFQPGVSVQARELTQLQTMLQEQIGSQGDHIFENGSVVSGGETILDVKYNYIKLSSYTWDATNWESQIKNLVISGTTGTSAKVVNFVVSDSTLLTGTVSTNGTTTVIGVGTKFTNELGINSIIVINGTKRSVVTITNDTTIIVNSLISSTSNGVAANISEPPTLYIQYLTGDSTVTNAVFAPLEVLTVGAYTATTEATNTLISPSTPSGVGSSVHIEEGIFYVDGFFVRVDKQTLILDKYNDTPTYKIGFNKIESIIDSTDLTYGSTLLDPSNGSFNYLAPGANRYQITLNIIKKSTTSTDTGSFVELMKVKLGTIQKHIKYPIYSDIERTLARRTFDESGNYTLRPFNVYFKDHPSNTSKLSLAVSSGKAYVFGHEFETLSTTNIDFDKARDFKTITGGDVYCRYGNYCIVNNYTGSFRIDTLESVTLRDSSSANIGTAKIRNVIYNEGTPGDSQATYKLYLFDIVFTTSKSFKDVNQVLSTVSGGDSLVADVGRTDVNADGIGDPGGDAILFGTDFNRLVWSMPNEAIKRSSIINTAYRSRKVFNGKNFSSGSLTLTTGSSTQTFIGAGSLSSVDKSTHFLVVATAVTVVDGTGYAAGDVINFDSGSRSITVTGSSVVFSLPDSSGNFAATVDIIATVENDEATAQNTKAKILVSGNTTSIGESTVHANGQVFVNIGYNASSISLGMSDVTSIVGIYEDTTISPSSITTAKEVTTRFILDNGQRDNVYDHASIKLLEGQTAPTNKLIIIYDHFSHTGSGYFTELSYLSSGLTDDYADIPSYTSPTTGEIIELRDSLDFRPVRNTDADSFTDSFIPYPDVAWEADFQVYLPRIDKLYVDEKLNFGIVKGVSSLQLTEPNDIQNTMTLYKFEIPAYTFNKDKIKVTYIENKRYTMRDIGKIEKRIDRIEYYTSLNLLEKATTDLLITDNNGLDRFKNGILVDPFRGHSVGDVKHRDYSCSIDYKMGELRPRFVSDNVSLRDGFSSVDSSNVTKTGDLITLNYTEEDFVSQQQASKKINVNPFNVTSFVGDMTMSPPSDFWVDTATRPDVIVNSEGSNDAWVAINNNQSSTGFGTQWNDWNVNWSGDEVTSSSIVRDVSAQHSVFNPRSGFKMQRIQTVQRNTTNVTQSQTRSGIRTSIIPDGITADINQRLIDINIIPFIRNLTTTISATGMKPRTRLYPFFDGTDVSVHCNNGGAIYTDVKGSVVFNFIIPNGTFRTGDRTFRLIDNSANDIISATTMTEQRFVAQGILQNRSNVRREMVAEDRIINNIIQRDDVLSVRWTDPVAQTVLVDSRVYPDGMFISSLDLFFASKPTSSTEQLPITIQIRETVNGYPSQNILPYSVVVKDSVDVTVSTSDAAYTSTPTTFTFTSPVYLKPGEYAITILTNSQDYELFVGEMGKNILGTSRKISQQPYAGVLFKSQNASTWNAIQTEDLAFVLRKCLFTNTSGSIVVHNNTEPLSVIETDLIELSAHERSFDKTSSNWSIKTTDSVSNVLSAYSSIITNENVEFDSRQKITTSIGSFVSKTDITTANTDISPVIDMSRMNIITVENKINNTTTGETNSFATPVISGGSEARYITRIVNLDTNAANMKVLLTAYKPSLANIKVYYKVLSPEDAGVFDDKSWVELTLSTNTNLFSSDDTTFHEYEYDTVGSLLKPQVDITYSDGTTTFNSFNQFSVKVVMLSPSTTKIPRIQDLRVISLI